MSDASGRKVRTTVFKPYTWTRIYKTKNADKDIFFTVGVDGVRKVLVYKLDYKNIPGPHLTPAQRTICEEHIKKSPAGWVEIKEQQLAEYTWERLINETVAFIQRYASLYDQVVHEVLCKRADPAGADDFQYGGVVHAIGPLREKQGQILT